MSLEDILRDADERIERGPDLVREVVAREGADAVVQVAARLIESRAEAHGEAVLFLEEGLELPALHAAVEASAELRAAVASLLGSKSFLDRRSAISALDRLPLSGATELLLAAGTSLLAAGDVMSVADVVAITGPSTITADLLKSDDFLHRWAVLAWTNRAASSPLADTVREQLSADPHPLVAAEAAQHIKILADLKNQSFGVASNGGRALSFRTVTSRFVAFWPPGKTTYTLEELRAFVDDQTKR